MSYQEWAENVYLPEERLRGKVERQAHSDLKFAIDADTGGTVKDGNGGWRWVLCPHMPTCTVAAFVPVLPDGAEGVYGWGCLKRSECGLSVG